MLNSDKKSMFHEFLNNIFSDSLTTENLKRFGIKINSKDYDYLHNNLYDVINSLDLKEIINFFKSGDFPKKDFEFNNICSDTDITSWDSKMLTTYPIYQSNSKHNNQALIITMNIFS